MRKLLALLLLVPFAAVLVFGCDEVPTEPETAVAATTAEGSSTPMAARAAPQVKPAQLSGVFVDGYAAGESSTSRKNATVPCPEGKWPISGGFEITNSSNDYAVLKNRPVRLSGAGGWEVEAKRTAVSASWNLIAGAVCVDAEPATP